MGPRAESVAVMKHEINLAPGLKFDALDLATEVVASLGNRGGGKSNGAALIAEQLLDAGVQVIVLDYVGIHFSLRLEPDGKTPSRFQIPVLGGTHGDIGLAATAGAMVAEALAERHSSAVLDISAFTKGDRCRFATDFAEAFFRAKKKHPGPVQLFLEESQRFVPQRVQPDQARMLGAFEEIAEVGRNYGIGLHLISQRPQKISKDVLNLADTVFGYRTMGVLERKAIAEWVQEKGADGRAQVHDELPMLDRGQAIVWSPSRQIFGRYQIRKKSTYDAGATPIHARADVTTKPLDLGALESAMGKAVEEAKANDPARLRAEIAKLKAELTKRPSGAVAEKRVEVPTVPREWVEQVGRARLRAQALTKEAGHALAEAGDLAEAFAKIEKASQLPGVFAAIPGVTRPRLARSTGQSHQIGPRAASTSEARMGIGERRVLTAIAQHRNGVQRDQLTVLTGYKRSTRDAYVQRLRVAGLVTDDGDGIRATPEGIAALPADFDPLPTGAELLAYWRNRLPAGECGVLEVVVAAYPNAVDRSTIEGETGFKRSTRDAYLQRLRARRLVVDGHDGIRASEALFG